jgi:hypothetical protein
MCTNTSFEPSLGVMKPKPFWVLKNLTVPVAIVAPLRYALLALGYTQAMVAWVIETPSFGGALLSAQRGSAARPTEN